MQELPFLITIKCINVSKILSCDKKKGWKLKLSILKKVFF